MIFSDQIDAEVLRSCLNTGTGRGVSVGILDSGVSCQLPILEGCVEGNFEVDQIGDSDEYRVKQVPLGEDTIAHGTACAHIIHSHAAAAALFSMQVIGSTHSAPTPKLVAALEFAVDQKWDILNISLGNETLTPEIAELADRAFYNGTLVIAAKDNKPGKIGYPAACASVLAVDMDFFDEPLKFRFHENNPVEVEGSGVYIDCPLPNGTMQSYTGSSFACPHITAIAARLREHFPQMTMDQFRAALRVLDET
ncbi:S8 family serine peptidase [Verrucomicrobiales bacterium]|nr:S8 family serine peptidase [Verrucomicrobiales bacterium]